MKYEDKTDLNHLALLCRIHLSDEEKQTLRPKLDKILEYIHSLDETDTTDVPPCQHILETMVNVTREDEPKEGFDPREFLKNAPDQVGGMIKVPPIIQFEE